MLFSKKWSRTFFFWVISNWQRVEISWNSKIRIFKYTSKHCEVSREWFSPRNCIILRKYLCDFEVQSYSLDMRRSFRPVLLVQLDRIMKFAYAKQPKRVASERSPSAENHYNFNHCNFKTSFLTQKMTVSYKIHAILAYSSLATSHNSVISRGLFRINLD